MLISDINRGQKVIKMVIGYISRKKSEKTENKIKMSYLTFIQ